MPKVDHSNQRASQERKGVGEGESRGTAWQHRRDTSEPSRQDTKNIPVRI